MVKNWPHLWAHNLPRGEPRGQCRYLTDWVPPHTSFKSKQEAGCASTCCHVPCSFGTHLSAEVGSGIATCPTTPDLASLTRWASALQHLPWPRTSPPCRGWFRRRYVSRGPGPRLPAELGSGAATCPAALDLASLPRWAPTLSRVS
jgi:hypothetical protein